MSNNTVVEVRACEPRNHVGFETPSFVGLLNQRRVTPSFVGLLNQRRVTPSFVGLLNQRGEVAS